MNRFRYSLRFMLLIVLACSAACGILIQVKKREPFEFMISSVFYRLDLTAIDAYSESLAALGMDTRRISQDGELIIVGTANDSSGIVTVTLRYRTDRCDLRGHWDGSFGIVDLMSASRQRDLGEHLRIKYSVPWSTLIESKSDNQGMQTKSSISRFELR